MLELDQMLSRLDVALMQVPVDLISALVAFGSEQAFIWVGQRPRDDNDYYFQLGNHINNMCSKAWENELNFRDQRWK